MAKLLSVPLSASLYPKPSNYYSKFQVKTINYRAEAQFGPTIS